MKVELIDDSKKRGMLTSPTFGWISFETQDGTQLLVPCSNSTNQNSSENARGGEKKPNLADLSRILLKNIEIKDRTYRFQSYKDCFVGSEAVTWMVENGYARSREQAVREKIFSQK